MTMTFYKNTRIECWQSRQQSLVRFAFQESRARHSISRPDQERLKASRRHELLAVNSFSRRIWGERVCDQISRHLCNGGDGSWHNQNVYFVSLMDIVCARSPEDCLTEADLKLISNRLRFGLKKFSYIGMIEPAYYVDMQRGVRFAERRCMFWHLHALVWGVSRKELKRHLRKMVNAKRYVSIAEGLDGTNIRTVKQGHLPACVGYMLKSPSSVYRVSARDRKDPAGKPVIDSDGIVLRRFRQGKSALRHGDQIVLFHAMKHLYLDELAAAGGAGAQLLRTIKRLALRDDSFDVSKPSKVRRSRRVNI